MTDAIEETQWPWFSLLVAQIAGLILCGVVTPSLDGNNVPRILFIVGLWSFCWGRYILARVRQEQNKTYIFYVTLIVLAPILEIGLESLFT